jgi:hypothetical protein
MPPNVTALCCCLETQNSNNEFDVALFEALHGRADFNKDGIVDLDEVIRYCELRVKEIQGGRLTPVMRKAKNLRGPVPLTKVAPNLVGVVAKGEMYSALLGKQEGERYQIHLIGWDDKPGMPYFVTNTVPRENLCLPADGPAVLVERKGRWQPACLLRDDGKDYKIRYLGSKPGEEVVTAERLRPLFSTKSGPLGKSYRYVTACAAALAGTGKGAGAANARKQALASLRHELEARAASLERDPLAAVRVHEDLRQMQADPDLAGLRGDKALAGYSAEERDAWAGFWRAATRLEETARQSYTQSEFLGRLSRKQRERSFPVEMKAGKTYVIEMTSPQFDTYLRLEDGEGNVVDENDDISKDNLNSRKTNTAPADGSYRVLATSYQQRGAGSYTLTIRGFAARKK